jgi:glucan phosphorylase
MIDRKDWENLQGRNNKRISPTVYKIAQSAPKMEILTNSNEWDEFLSYVQPHIEQAKAGMEDLIKRLLVPELWNTEEMTRIKGAILVLEDRISTLTTMVEIPRKIIEQGKKADKVLET